MAGSSDQALQAAIEYVSRGWAVFPCHPDTKQPLVKGDTDASGKLIQGTGGLKKATTDPLIIRAWWTQWPKALIGLPTGNNVGAFVVDIDAGLDAATGEEFIAEALKAALETSIGVPLPDTVTCATPRGGWHLYFSIPEGAEMPGNRAGMLPRIDVRGNGGYVIVPPSARHDGKFYYWIKSPTQLPVAVAPQALLDLIFRRSGNTFSPKNSVAKRSLSDGQSPVRHRQRRYALAAFDLELRDLRAAAAGTRNDSLFRASIALGQLVAAGTLDIGTVRAGLEGVARDWPNFRKSLGTIDSGLSKGQNEPRDLDEVGQLGGVRAAVHGGGEGTDLDRKLAFEAMTDLGNALRFKERNQGSFLHSEISGWFWWNGRRWSLKGTDGALWRAVHETVRALNREADAVDEYEP